MSGQTDGQTWKFKGSTKSGSKPINSELISSGSSPFFLVSRDRSVLTGVFKPSYVEGASGRIQNRKDSYAAVYSAHDIHVLAGTDPRSQTSLGQAKELSNY